MKFTYQIEPTSTARLLTCFDLAVEEAKLVRSLIVAKAATDNPDIAKPVSKRLIKLDREIIFLETKLAEIRSQASKRLIDKV